MRLRSIWLGFVATSWILSALVIAGCCSGPRAALPAIGFTRVAAEQEEAAVIVTSACVDGSSLRIKAGSGVLSSDRTVLTAAHVISCPDDGSNAVVIELASKKQIKAEVLLIDRAGDIAQLKLATPARLYAAARLGPRPAADALICLVSAVPQRERRCGEVEQFVDPPGDVRHNAITMPGNSGSGVYDTYGRLVGIVTHFSQLPNGQFSGGKFSSLEGRAWAAQ